MIYDILETKLISAGLAIEGETLFRETMPAECDIGLMFRSPLEGIDVDPHMPGWFKPTLQLIVRHTSPVEGQKLCDDAIRVLLVRAEERHPATNEHGPARIAAFYPAQLPIRYPTLEGNGIEWSVHFTTAFNVEPAWL